MREIENRRCDVYANIIEEESGGRLTVCSGDVRYKHLYTTTSNSVEIQIINIGEGADNSAYFAIAFQGIIYSILCTIKNSV